MGKSQIGWVKKTLAGRLESEVDRRLTIVARNFSGFRADGAGGATTTVRAKLVARAEQELLGQPPWNDKMLAAVEREFEGLPRQLAVPDFVDGSAQIPIEVLRTAERLDALAAPHGEVPLASAIADIQAFYTRAESYLNSTRLRGSDSQLAVRLSERLWFLGRPLTETGTRFGTRSSTTETEQTTIADLDAEFPKAMRVLKGPIHSGQGRAGSLLQDGEWGVRSQKTKALTISGVNHWAANELGISDDRIRTACRALAVHLVAQVAAQPPEPSKSDKNQTVKEVIVASPLFDPLYSRDAADVDLLLEFEHAIHMALRAGWRVIRVLSREMNDGQQSINPVDLNTELVIAVLINLITPGVYETIVNAPLTTPDAIVARQTAAITYTTPSSPNRKHPWLPRAVTRAVQWGTHERQASRTVRGLYDDVRTEIDQILSPGPRGEDQDPYMQKWITRADLLLPTDGIHAFDRALTVSELIPGDRLVLKGGFSTSTLPDAPLEGPNVSSRQIDAWKAEIRDLVAKPEWATIAGDLSQEPEAAILDRIERLAQKRRVRQFAFRTNCEHHRYWDLVPLDHLTAYATHRTFEGVGTSNALYGSKHLTLEDRRLHLAAIRDQLLITADRISTQGPDAPGYRLGLTTPDDLPFDLGNTWIIITTSDDARANQVHFIHRDLERDQRVLAVLRLSAITKHDLPRSFEALFDAAWATVTPRHTNPATVADLITGLIQSPPISAPGTPAPRP